MPPLSIHKYEYLSDTIGLRSEVRSLDVAILALTILNKHSDSSAT